MWPPEAVIEHPSNTKRLTLGQRQHLDGLLLCEDDRLATQRPRHQLRSCRGRMVGRNDRAWVSSWNKQELLPILSGCPLSIPYPCDVPR